MKGKKTGGRQVGTPNKASLTAQGIFEAAGFDPLEKMVKIAQETERGITEAVDTLRALEEECDPPPSPEGLIAARKLVRDLRADFERQCAELCQYRHPKRKAVEVAGDAFGPPVSFKMVLG